VTSEAEGTGVGSVPGRPLWLGARVRRAVALGGLIALGVLAGGWPYWRHHPAAAAVTLLSCGLFAVSGNLLTAGRQGRRTGRLFLFASVAWAITWHASWNTGGTPLVSVFAQSAFYFAIGLGILVYPGGRLESMADRIWTGAAGVVLFGGQALLCVTSRPEWNGFAASVVWPSFLADRAVFTQVLRVMTVALVALGVALVLLLALRFPRSGRLGRRFAVPLTAAAALGSIAAAASQGTISRTDVRLTDVMHVYAIQGTFAIAVPLVFLATRLRERLAELTVAERVQRLAVPPSVERVRDALRRVLHDDTLQLWFWIPAKHGYVDDTGRRAAEAAAAEPGRWRQPIRSATGAPLAAVDLDTALRDHPSLVEAALVACGRALESAQLEATAQALLEQARASQERLIRVELAERERFADDLRRSTQVRLRRVESMLETLESMAGQSPAHAQARACRHELAEAVTEIGDLARGLHPAVLTEVGLGAALISVADRLAAPISLEVTKERFAPEIESTLYFALCEAMTNAVKHAHATRIRLTVRAGADAVTAEVADDGVGRARPRPAGGGLSGIADRVGALRGTVRIDSPPDGGTTLRMSIPYR
jgi:signal transduction histidine kinase